MVKQHGLYNIALKAAIDIYNRDRKTVVTKASPNRFR